MKIRSMLNANQLKLLACLFMLVDHIGYLLLPQYQILRIVGRLSFPLFAVMAANGWQHSHNRILYLLRLSIFALLFQPVFRICMATSKWNIFATLFLGLLAIACYEVLSQQIHQSAGLIAVIAIAMLANLIYVDYSYYGVLLILSSYLFFHNKRALCLSWLLLNLLYCYNQGNWLQIYSLLALPLFFLYNGARGRGSRWFFYLFYCLHIPLLWGLGHSIL